MAFSKGLMAIVERGRSFSPKAESDVVVSTLSVMQDPTPRRALATSHGVQRPSTSRQEQMGWGGWGFARARFA